MAKLTLISRYSTVGNGGLAGGVNWVDMVTHSLLNITHGVMSDILNS